MNEEKPPTMTWGDQMEREEEKENIAKQPLKEHKTDEAKPELKKPFRNPPQSERRKKSDGASSSSYGKAHGQTPERKDKFSRNKSLRSPHNASRNNSTRSPHDKSSPQSWHSDMPLCTDENKLRVRQRQIDIGKGTPEYARYVAEVSHRQRTKDHPWTPNKNYEVSTRSWQGSMRVWRRKLHHWDPENSGNSAVAGRLERSEDWEGGNPADDSMEIDETGASSLSSSQHSSRNSSRRSSVSSSTTADDQKVDLNAALEKSLFG